MKIIASTLQSRKTIPQCAHLLLCLLTLLALALPGCGVSYLLNSPVPFPPTIARADLPHVFPKSFLLGTATSAHQIEGGNSLNDWARFEKLPGTIKNADHCGAAADAWNRVPQDIALMQSLGANAYRFSIEWSRLEPTPGHFDEVAFKHYQDQLNQLHAAGITPMITLLHFTLPQWLADRGGLLAPDFPARFAAFTHQAVVHLGPKVTLWCTINEPSVQMYYGYLDGAWPPGEHSKPHAIQAFSALLKAHAAAAAVLHRELPAARVGVAQNLVCFEPRSWANPLDWLTASAAADAFNWAFYDSIAAGRIQFHAPGYPALDEPLPGLKHSADFFGMNYYFRVLVGIDFHAPNFVKVVFGPGPKSDLGWEIHPEGLLQLLRASYKRYHLPIYITENGLADASGATRAAFLDDHLYAVALALKEGVPVQGYFHWSLYDNFEWAQGFSPRFGIFHTDYATQTRLPTPASIEFHRLAQQILP